MHVRYSAVTLFPLMPAACRVSPVSRSVGPGGSKTLHTLAAAAPFHRDCSLFILPCFATLNCASFRRICSLFLCIATLYLRIVTSYLLSLSGHWHVAIPHRYFVSVLSFCALSQCICASLLRICSLFLCTVTLYLRIVTSYLFSISVHCYIVSVLSF